MEKWSTSRLSTLSPAPSKQEAGCTGPDVSETKIYLASAGNRNLDRAVHSLATTLFKLSSFAFQTGRQN